MEPQQIEKGPHEGKWWSIIPLFGSRGRITLGPDELFNDAVW